MSFWKFLDRRVDEQIQEAMDRGEFENLPGKGKPLNLEEDAHVAPELRMAYRILKRAGIPPEEVILAKGAAGLREKLLSDASLTEEEKTQIRRKIALLDMEYNMRVERFRKQYSGY
jgi:Domain of unknown function (DUF1992)